MGPMFPTCRAVSLRLRHETQSSGSSKRRSSFTLRDSEKQASLFLPLPQ